MVAGEEVMLTRFLLRSSIKTEKKGKEEGQQGRRGAPKARNPID